MNRLRRLLLAALLFGLAGLGLELLLMEHVEGFWQQLPIGVLGAALAATIALAMSRSRWCHRVFQTVMVLVALCGLLGVWLHFDGKAEFKLEIDPTLSGMALLRECLVGHSLPPVLAPGMMLLL
ncbi:MAG TPA: hypothetical protein DCY13_08580, partial [Verrucomicrobiales bacterium]|nr:hypothetical protein [Verrucomicrobiales bacterium]